MKRFQCYVLLILGLCIGVLRAGDDRFNELCNAGTTLMKKNMELFRHLQLGFTLKGTESCNSTFIAECKNIENAYTMADIGAYMKLPERERQAVAGGVQAYDNMIDAWAHIYYEIGVQMNRKAFYEGKKLMVETLDTWEHTPFYGTMYEDLMKQRKGLENNLKFFRKDFAEIEKVRMEYSHEVLSTDNIMRKRIAVNPENWPLNKSDLKAWNLPRTYGLPFYTDDLKITDSYLSKTRKLDEFCNRAKDLKKAATAVNEAYSAWIHIYEELPAQAKKVKALADSRFAQDWLTADFRETMEDTADLLLYQYDKIKQEVLGENGYKELDKALNFYESTVGSEVCRKQGLLFSGANGATDSIEKMWLSFSDEMRSIYDNVAMSVTHGPMMVFGKEATNMMKSNKKIIDEAAGGFSMFGVNLTNPTNHNKLASVNNVRYFKDFGPYKALPQLSREAVRPYVEQYDLMLDGFRHQYLSILTDVTNEKFARGQIDIGNTLFHWVNRSSRWKDYYNRFLGYRQKMDKIYQKIKKDLDDIQRHQNDATPNGLANDNELGKLLKKEPRRWPLKDGDFQYWKLRHIYHIDWLQDNGEMTYEFKNSLELFNNVCKSFPGLPERLDFMRQCYANWDKYEKTTIALADKAKGMINSSQAKKIFPEVFMAEYLEACEQAHRHQKHLYEQLHCMYGIGNLETIRAFASQSAFNELKNRTGLLFKGPNGSTNSVLDTFEQYRKVIKDYYLRVGK